MEWFLIVVGGFLTAAVVAILVTSVDNSRADLAFRRSVVRKVSWAILLIGGICLYLTVPSVRFYHHWDSQLQRPSEAEVLASPAKYIRDNQLRIERLEEALAETQDELTIWRRHYKVVIDVMFWTTFAIASYQLFDEKKDVFNGGNS